MICCYPAIARHRGTHLASLTLHPRDEHNTLFFPLPPDHRAVMHLIDAAIVPGYPTLAAALASNPQLSTLAAAVAADGTLAAIASGAVPFTGTFLAPNNE